MTALDIIVFFALGFGAIFGFLRGFVQEVFALFAWVLILVAIRFLHEPVSAYLVEPVGSESGAVVVAFLAVAVVTYALGRWLARALGRRSRGSILGPFDRVLGFGFGLVKGLVVSTLVFLLAVLFYDTAYGVEGRPDWIVDARTYTLMNASGEALSEFLAKQRDAMSAEADADSGGADPGQAEE